MEGYPPGCGGPQLVWENQNAPALHGQAVCIGELIAGPDVFGHDAREALITPKGIPGTTGITSGAQWSYAYNGNGWELAFCYPSQGPPGPRDFGARNIDWDGDRTTDEIYASYAGTHEVWRIVPDPAWTGDPSQEPDFSSFPDPGQAQGNWPAFAYRFDLVASFDDGIWSGHAAEITCDLFGDYREELVIPGRNGIEIGWNTDPLAEPAAHPSPWTDLAWRRRMQGDRARTVDYQELGKLDHLEVVPQVTAAAPGGQVAFQVFAVHTNGHRQDVTADATFAAGPLGSFSGSVFTAGGSPGLCAVQATVGTAKSTNAAVVNITQDPTPVIVYAGYADSYITGTPSDLTVEIGIADPEGDVQVAGLAIGGTVVTTTAHDDGLGGDRVAGDGVWTCVREDLALPPQDFAPPANPYVETFAIDAAGNGGDVWPYLTVGSGGYPAVLGTPPQYSPFPSESFTQGPPVKLAGTGLFPSAAPAGTAGSTTLLARTLPGEAPDAILVAANGQLVGPAGLNDAGQAPDQLAGDGLWTGTLSWSNLPDGLYAVELVARRISPPGLSDAYPRLRAHP